MPRRSFVLRWGSPTRRHAQGAAMVKVSIEDSLAVFDVQGLHKLWALKSRLEIPLAHIHKVRSDPHIARGWWKGFRMPGTHVPGVLIAGTFYHQGKRIFWDVRNPEHAIVIELADERYDQLIIEVENPATEVSRLQAMPAA